LNARKDSYSKKKKELQYTQESMNTRQNHQLEQQRRFALERDRRTIQQPNTSSVSSSTIPSPPSALPSPTPSGLGSGPPPPIATRNPIQLSALSNNIIPAIGGGADSGLAVPPQVPEAPQAAVERANKNKEPGKEPVTAARLSADQRSILQRYIAIDDEISVLNAQIKDKRAERKQLEDELLVLLRKMDVPVQMGTTIIGTKKKSTAESLTQRVWVEKLMKSGQLKDPSKAEQLVKTIYKNREKTEDYELVRKNVAI
jgi:hypothetical protein